MAKTEIAKKTTISNFLNFPNTQKFLEENLKEKKGEFVSNLIALTEADETLAECEPKALLMCAMNATALNLSLNKNLGHAYVIPYKKDGKPIPQFQLGFKGILQLAIRTGQYEIINATMIRRGEITRNKITGVITFHKEVPDGDVIGYLSYLKLITGFSASLYMSEKEIENHASRYSKAYQNDKRKKTRLSKWSDPEERPKMALKTVLKGLLGTYGLMTTDLIKAFEVDNGEVERDSGQRFEDAEIITQDEPEPQDEQKEEGKPEKITLD